MQLDSVRELKQNLFKSVLSPKQMSAMARASGISARPVEAAAGVRLLAVGVAPRGETDYVLAVRIQSQSLVGSDTVARIVAQAANEADVRYIGRVRRLATPWQQKRVRPLKIGVSIGHYKITAGTLGCFVRSPGSKATMVLSNNHVLANENHAKKGDAILQPGAYDGGKRPADVVAKLERFVRLQTTGVNTVDCAVATLASGITFNAGTITGIGKLAGVGELHADPNVQKMGRTTGVTKGKITAFEVDNVLVGYDAGDLRFDNQVEIESAGLGPFSQGGDSGSLIVNGSVQAVALLFAGSDTGGSNGLGVTYANPLDAVLAGLKVELATK